MLKKILIFSLFLLPNITLANIIVSEVAWMGTSNSANDEWIELHNTGSSSVNLSGWTLNAGDGSPSINLSGSIPADGYALLERTDDSSAPGVSALVIYTGALSNDGEDLVLKNGDGNTIQSLNFSSGWPAGDSTSKQTMQWNGSGWITADETAGSSNASSGTGGENDDNQEDNSDDNSTDDEEEDEESSSSSSSSNTKIKYKKEVVDIKVVDSSIPVGSPVEFSLSTRDLDGGNIIRGDFFWNMGDGTERYYSRNEKLEHVYDHEGSYVVVVKYYHTYFEGMDPDATDKINITVSSGGVSLSKIFPDGSVEIKNNSSQEINLSNWSVKDSLGRTFIIPEGTYVLGNKSLVLNSKRLRMSPLEANLFSPNGSFVSRVSKFPDTVYKSKPSSGSQSSSSNVSNLSSLESKQEDDFNEDDYLSGTNLNERLKAGPYDSLNKKQPSVWMIVFFLLLVVSIVVVYFIYRKEENSNKDTIEEEDEFELLD